LRKKEVRPKALELGSWSALPICCGGGEHPNTDFNGRYTTPLIRLFPKHNANMDPFDAALDLLRRLPPSQTQQNLERIVQLVPDLEEELLSSVDVGLGVKTCAGTGKLFLTNDYNRDGDSCVASIIDI
jgi:hypothetical protein